MPDKLLEIRVDCSRKAIAALDTPQLLYLLLEVKAVQPDASRRTPLNLSLVLDRSTSMRGSRLASVQAAARLIVEQLAVDDHLSVVAFSDRASVVIPAGQQHETAQVLNKISQIDASGGTELYQGLEAGYRELRRAPLAEYNNHLILLTDGHTYGDSEACIDIVRDGAQDRINLSAFGIGLDWNQHFLDELAAIAGGETSFIAAPGQIVQALQQCINDLGAVYAHNLRLSRQFPSAFRLISAFRVGPIAQPLGANGNDIRLGNVENRVPLSFLLEFSVEPQQAGTELALDLQLLADIPSESMRDYRLKVHHPLRVLAHEPEEEPSESLIAAVQAWNFHRMNDNVWNDIEQGNLQRARTRMNKLTERLIEAGHTGLAQQLQDETKRLSAGFGVTPEGRKTLTFATRSLVSQTVRLRTIEDELLS